MGKICVHQIMMSLYDSHSDKLSTLSSTADDSQGHIIMTIAHHRDYRFNNL